MLVNAFGTRNVCDQFRQEALPSSRLSQPSKINDPPINGGTCRPPVFRIRHERGANAEAVDHRDEGEGMKFHMSGAWEVSITIAANGKPDKVTFGLDL